MSEKSKGIGDSLEKAFKATKIDKLAKAILGDNCGCEERKKQLNNLFPYIKNIRQFSEDEIKIYDEVVPGTEKRGQISKEEKIVINALYKGVFDSVPKWNNCSPCNKRIMDNLKKVYEKSCKV